MRDRRQIDINVRMPEFVHQLAHQLHEIRVLIQQTKEEIMADLAPLTAEVSEAVTVMQSASVLIEGLAQAIRDNASDPAALAALAADLDANSNALAAAVAANTPAPEEPPPA